MVEITEFLLMGIFLGLVAGVSPGPLLTMVISETLQHGAKEGVKVAISPLITDLLIVSAIVAILSHFESQNSIVALISLLGAVYLIHLGISSFKVKYSSLFSSKIFNSSFTISICSS